MEGGIFIGFRMNRKHSLLDRNFLFNFPEVVLKKEFTHRAILNLTQKQK